MELKRQLILVETADSMSENKNYKEEFGALCHIRNQGSYEIALPSC